METKQKRIHILAGFLIIFLYLLPYIIFGENSYVQINDNLNGSLAYYSLLASSGKITGSLSGTITQVMNGLPRNVLPGEFDVIVWLFYFFKPFTAYILNFTLMRFLAYIGMYLLLSRYFLIKKTPLFILHGSALSFTLLPFLAIGGSSIAVLPLALFAFLNIRSLKSKLIDWLIICLIPFYSSAILVYIFFLTILVLLCIYDYIKVSKLNFPFLLSLFLMAAIYIGCEYRLIFITFFDHSFVSQRTEFVSVPVTFTNSVKETLSIIRFSQYHSQSANFPVLLLCLVLGWILEYKRRQSTKLTRVILIILLFSFIYGFRDWNFFVQIKQRLNVLKIYDMSRFFYLLPFVWYLGFALSLQHIWAWPKWGRLIVLGILTSQIVLLFYKHEFIQGYLNHQPTFKQFYAEMVFSDIKHDLGEDTSRYRVVSLGLYPAIATYNGFYTLDFYLNNYPLQYKEEFREIIAPELAKDRVLGKKFDEWGNECYLFSASLPVRVRPKSFYDTYKLTNFDINTKKLKQMGGTYVFSAAEIKDAEKSQLKFKKVFTNDDSAWKIFVYEVI